MEPFDNPIDPVIGLITEPGAKVAENLLSTGFRSSSSNSPQRLPDVPYKTSFGSKEGLLTSANVSPVFGSTAAAVPASSSNVLNIFSCILMSMVVVIVFPSSTGISARTISSSFSFAIRILTPFFLLAVLHKAVPTHVTLFCRLHCTDQRQVFLNHRMLHYGYNRQDELLLHLQDKHDQ